MRRLLLLPHITIQNANALSSPYTIGFPAMTAWLGAVHALQRHLNNSGWDSIRLIKTGVSCHQFNLQTYRGNRDYVHSIIGTANPLDKDGERPAFIEEARCHLRVSILIEGNFAVIDPDAHNQFESDVATILQSKMKIAGGDILKLGHPKLIAVNEDEVDQVKSLLAKLMLGHVIIERRDLMEAAMKQDDKKDALDAMLHYLKVFHSAVQEEEGKIRWESHRVAPGWIVPIAVGYQGVSELGIAKNQRDATTPHRFAESVVTLGEFIMPYRIQHLDQLLWEYTVDSERNLYLCRNQVNF